MVNLFSCWVHSIYALCALWETCWRRQNTFIYIQHTVYLPVHTLERVRLHGIYSTRWTFEERRKKGEVKTKQDLPCCCRVQSSIFHECCVCRTKRQLPFDCFDSGWFTLFTISWDVGKRPSGMSYRHKWPADGCYCGENFVRQHKSNRVYISREAIKIKPRNFPRARFQHDISGTRQDWLRLKWQRSDYWMLDWIYSGQRDIETLLLSLPQFFLLSLYDFVTEYLAAPTQHPRRNQIIRAICVFPIHINDESL